MNSVNFFPIVPIFHINCYFIGKVSTMFGFLTNFGSPNSIFGLLKKLNSFFVTVNKKQEFCRFLSQIALFIINLEKQEFQRNKNFKFMLLLHEILKLQGNSIFNV